ncbi:protein transport protein Sec24A isoform X2 [Periplaneta americana]|uniref:protein transport protein Sec24A isoform X2 n=1 Tax=Periplaneta americana TaxID=6978 RepID=UPI0037E8BDB7
MAQPSGHPNIVASAAAQGVGVPPGPSLIPNGQPPQWNRPPAFPHAMKSRPPPTGSNIVASVTSNGTPTPPSYSHPGSLSSHSSRDPSPIPPNRPSESLSGSSQSLHTLNSQPPQQRPHLQQQSPTPPVLNASSQRGSPGMIVNSSHNRIMQPPAGQPVSTMYNTPGMPPSLVTQNSGQSKPVGVQQSSTSPQFSTNSPFPPSQRSNLASAPHVGPVESSSRPVSYQQNVASQNIPSQLNQSNQERLGTSQLPSNIHLQHMESSSNQQKFDGRPGPSRNMPPQANPSYAPYVQAMPGIMNGPPQQQPMSRPGLGMGMSQSMQGQTPMMTAPVPRTNSQGFVPPQPTSRPMGQPGPPSGVPPMPNPPSGIHGPMPSQPGIMSQQPQPPVSQQMTQHGIVSPMGNRPAQQGMPPMQPGMAPGPPMPPTSMGYSQPPMPPTSSQYQSMPQSGAVQHDVSHLGKRYPQQTYQQRGQSGGDALAPQMSGLSVTQMGFNKLWGLENVDLLQNRNVLPPEKVEAPKVRLHQEFLDSVNCSSEIFRCTLTKIPETNSLLQKSRLPLGILIHPFKDLNHLPVIQCSTIVRCRSCRTYINPFVYFVDHKRWKCNLCFRVNELPEEFQFDPVSKTYGDPTRRPEIKSSTIEFIAPSEYMLRPPQPAVYLFLLDVSRLGVECGYLRLFCDILLEELDKLPGDGRTQIGFITYDSSVHFYNLAEGLSQPQQMIVVDTDDVFLPCPDNLLVNLSESRELVKDLLNQIPTKFINSHDTNSALGPALQAAYKLMAPTGGRVTVFQSCLPNHGPGSLTAREDPSQRAGKEAPHLNPATDFYKRLALDCSGQQIAVDLFLINSQYSDLATISGISRFSGGCIYHFPLFKTSNTVLTDSLERTFRRYLTRKIGFEAVMRIRCSRGLAIHTFHGNFFVRSTDLLSLPNVNPDAGFGMQVSVEESLSDVQNVCFQAALLYTSSKGERRIRVHTLCLPVAANLSDILYSADQQCIVGLLAKMAVDRSHQSSLSDARDAFINVAIDVLSAYKLVQSSGGSASLLAPSNLRLLPLYILALLKYVAFRTGQSTRLDDRLFAMCQMKTLPLTNLIQAIYPDMYPVHYLDDKQNCAEIEADGIFIPQPPRLHLSAEKLDSHGAFLLDAGDHMMMYVGHNISNEFCTAVLGVPSFAHIPDEMYELPEIESPESERLRNFVNYLQNEKPYQTMLQVIRDDSHYRVKFIERLIEDRSESALSYYEFLQHLKSNVK